MIHQYSYTEFKRKLITNPKWIARGLQVILDHTSMMEGPAKLTLNLTDQIHLNRMVNQLAFASTTGGLPWTPDSKDGREAIFLVTRHAPTIYNYYVQLDVVPETTS